jgi:ribosomal protein S11
MTVTFSSLNWLIL